MNGIDKTKKYFLQKRALASILAALLFCACGAEKSREGQAKSPASVSESGAAPLDGGTQPFWQALPCEITGYGSGNGEGEGEGVPFPVTVRSLGILGKEDYLNSTPNYRLIDAIR